MTEPADSSASAREKMNFFTEVPCLETLTALAIGFGVRRFNGGN